VVNVDDVTDAAPEARATVWFNPPGPVKVTVPVGVPVESPFAVTVAVSVTVCPVTDGSGVADRPVVVGAGFTVTAFVPDDPV
jgi:hypothetical protein